LARLLLLLLLLRTFAARVNDTAVHTLCALLDLQAPA
jgi:hypothetical protein